MQFKALLAAAMTAQSVFAMSSTQQGQIKQNEKSVQSQQVHQLEDLAQSIHAQQQQQDVPLSLTAPTLNASAITDTLTSLNNVFTTTSTAISNITATTLASQLPNVITAISSLAGTVVSSAGSIITVPVINVYSIADQQLIFNAFSQFVGSNTALINSFVGPNGLVANSLLRGPIGVVLNLIERTIVNLAGAIIARIPAFADQAQGLLSQLHGALALTISF